MVFSKMKKFYLILPAVFLSNISSVCALLPDQLLVNNNKNVINHRRLTGNIKNNKISAMSIAGKIQGTFYLKKFCEKNLLMT